MVMSKGKKVAIGTAISVVAGAAIVAGVVTAKPPSVAPPPPPPTSNYTISLTASTTTVTAGQTVLFTATVLNNGVPASGIPVTLTDQTTGGSASTTTNSSGIAEFDVTFSASQYPVGTYTLYATAVVPS